jgi:signal peptidase I
LATKSKTQQQGGVLDTVKTVVYAVLIALFVRTVAYEPFNIPSGSMIPTLLVGDYLFVSKFSYGYSRYSLPLGLPLFSGRIFFTPPERGDVAVFKKPTDNSTDYIKRIIGLPGDRIQVKGGILFINDEPAKREFVGPYADPDGPRGFAYQRYIETLPNGRRHSIIEIGDNQPLDNTPVFVVPPKHFFMMGDNRDNSQDSRTRDVGFVPMENLVGRAEFLFFSIDPSAHWWEIWKWPTSIRWGRPFSAIR